MLIIKKSWKLVCESVVSEWAGATECEIHFAVRLIDNVFKMYLPNLLISFPKKSTFILYLMSLTRIVLWGP